MLFPQTRCPFKRSLSDQPVTCVSPSERCNTTWDRRKSDPKSFRRRFRIEPKDAVADRTQRGIPHHRERPIGSDPFKMYSKALYGLFERKGIIEARRASHDARVFEGRQ